jgi:hypothetical protein
MSIHAIAGIRERKTAISTASQGRSYAAAAATTRTVVESSSSG